MKNNLISIFKFKLKFILPRTSSTYLKKKIKYKKDYLEFTNLIKKKDFSAYWFLNNYKIIGNFLPEDYSKKFKYLEIGSFEGLSSLFILFNWSNADVTCIDTWKISDDESQILDFDFGKVEQRFDKNLNNFSITKIKSKSTEALKTLQEKRSAFDYIYIDGSHNGEEIYNDAVESFAILNIGGMIIFDDINNIYEKILIQPHNAFEKFYNVYKNKIKILYLKNIAIIKKISY